jgi:Domain of unknown function (DUF3536)/Glycosyl hydrolase family 57
VTARPRLIVHGHFYQPSRADPWSDTIPDEPDAAPYRHWNERIDAECYRPNVERGNLSRISFDLGPTLATWLAREDPTTYAGILASDQPGGRAMAQSYHHSILPLASMADRRTEIRWGLRDFELRFGRPARGLWLPETAVDLPTLRILAEEGVAYTILAPWQAADPDLDHRRPHRVSLGGGHSIVVVFYDAGMSGAVSFDGSATADADRFAAEHVSPRLADAEFDDGTPALAVIATDGELFGHHRAFRDLFLQRLVAPQANLAVTRPFDVVGFATALEEPDDRRFPQAMIVERTSWSCHHGIARWSSECPDATDGRWKGPLRAALDRLAAGIDAVSEGLLSRRRLDAEMLGSARDAYVDVVFGAISAEAFAGRWLPGGRADDRRVLQSLLEAQRWRLAMFASDAWFWEDPARIETAQVLRAAARAVRIVDGLAETHLERRLVDDLSLLAAPSRGPSGVELYRESLAAVGQPPPS